MKVIKNNRAVWLLLGVGVLAGGLAPVLKGAWPLVLAALCGAVLALASGILWIRAFLIRQYRTLQQVRELPDRIAEAVGYEQPTLGGLVHHCTGLWIRADEIRRRDADRMLLVIYDCTNGDTTRGVSMDEVKARLARDHVLHMSTDEFCAYQRRAQDRVRGLHGHGSDRDHFVDIRETAQLLVDQGMINGREEPAPETQS